jgi:hypothetical protein
MPGLREMHGREAKDSYEWITLKWHTQTYEYHRCPLARDKI